MCINCLVNKQKLLSKQPAKEEEKPAALACKHPPHMKCLRCLPKDQAPKCKRNCIKQPAPIQIMKNARNVNG